METEKELPFSAEEYDSWYVEVTREGLTGRVPACLEDMAVLAFKAGRNARNDYAYNIGYRDGLVKGRQESSAKTQAYKALDSLRVIIDSLPE